MKRWVKLSQKVMLINRFSFGNEIELGIECSVESSRLILDGHLKDACKNLQEFSKTITELKEDNKTKDAKPV